MKITSNYISTDDTNIIFREKRSRIEFNNPSRKMCFKVDVDGGLIKGTDKRKCDYLLIVAKPETHDIDQRESEHFVELKGVDVLHGISQLEETIPVLWISKDNLDKDHRFAYCVCAKVSPQINTQIQKQMLRLKNKYNTTLKVRENLKVSIV